jgi:hypothetical protein
MYNKYEILKLLVSFCRFVNLQIVRTKEYRERRIQRTKTFIRKRRRRLLTFMTKFDCPNKSIYPAISTFAVQIYHTNKFLLYS